MKSLSLVLRLLLNVKEKGGGLTPTGLFGFFFLVFSFSFFTVWPFNDAGHVCKTTSSCSSIVTWAFLFLYSSSAFGSGSPLLAVLFREKQTLPHTHTHTQNWNPKRAFHACRTHAPRATPLFFFIFLILLQEKNKNKKEEAYTSGRAYVHKVIASTSQQPPRPKTEENV